MIRQWRFSVYDWQKLLERDGGLVAIEQTEAGEMLAKFTLHSDLDQVTLKQNSTVLADEPKCQCPLHQCKYYCWLSL